MYQQVARRDGGCSSPLRDPVVILPWGYCGVLVVVYRKLKLSFALACRARIGPKLDSPWGANIGPHRRSTGLFPCGDGRGSESGFKLYRGETGDCHLRVGRASISVMAMLRHYETLDTYALRK